MKTSTWKDDRDPTQRLTNTVLIAARDTSKRHTSVLYGLSSASTAVWACTLENAAQIFRLIEHKSEMKYVRYTSEKALRILGGPIHIYVGDSQVK